MSGTSFVAYIDESGDEGWKFGEGSSEWFVLSAVVLWKRTELETVKLVDEVRKKLNDNRKDGRFMPEKKPLHFRDLKHEQKKFYAARIGEGALRTVSICIHKPSLTKPESFRKESHLYFYATKFMVERVARLCHGLRPQNCATELCFSNRATMDYGSLKSYLEFVDSNRQLFGFGGHSGVFSKERVTVCHAGQRMGLQIADAVASSYYLALEPNGFGQTEESYAKLMLSRAATINGERWGRGVKIYPKEAEVKHRGGPLDFKPQ